MKIPWYLLTKRKGRGEYKTVSGPVVSVSDALAAALRNLLVSIDPVQDFHGYANPWPAGGGKNKFLANASGGSAVNVSFTRNADGSVTFTGLANGTTRVPTIGSVTLPAGTYILSGVTGGSESTYGLRVSEVVGGSVSSIDTIYDGETTFTLTEQTDIRIIGRFSATQTTEYNVTMYPMIRLASETDPTYAPYSNICPISGWREANVWVQPTHDTTTTPTVNITFPNEAETVYSGTVDVTNGVLTVTHKRVDMGDLDWFYTTATYEHRFFVVDISDGQHQRTGTHDVSFWCSAYKALAQTVNGTTMGSIVDDCCIAVNQRGQSYPLRIFLRDDSYAGNAEAFKTSVTGQTLVYPLEIPLTYQLTPQEVMTLLGTNNIWADTGDVTVEYLSGGGTNPDLMKLAVAFMKEG